MVKNKILLKPLRTKRFAGSTPAGGVPKQRPITWPFFDKVLSYNINNCKNVKNIMNNRQKNGNSTESGSF